MRGELQINSLPVKMVNNHVLVLTEDKFSGFRTKGGIDVVNLTTDDTWGDSNQFTVSEFAMRRGQVILAPKTITKGSFSYETECEVQTGDIVFWNLASFQGHIPLKHDGKLYLMVDYHEILAYLRDGELTPVNGFGLFKPVKGEQKALQHTVTTKVSDDWVLHKKPVKTPVYSHAARSIASCWQPGDKVKLLVRQSPYKLEGNYDKSLPEDLYACPMNYIICTS